MFSETQSLKSRVSLILGLLKFLAALCGEGSKVLDRLPYSRLVQRESHGWAIQGANGDNLFTQLGWHRRQLGINVCGESECGAKPGKQLEPITGVFVFELPDLEIFKEGKFCCWTDSPVGRESVETGCRKLRHWNIESTRVSPWSGAWFAWFLVSGPVSMVLPVVSDTAAAEQSISLEVLAYLLFALTQHEITSSLSWMVEYLIFSKCLQHLLLFPSVDVASQFSSFFWKETTVGYHWEAAELKHNYIFLSLFLLSYKLLNQWYPKCYVKAWIFPSLFFL